MFQRCPRGEFDLIFGSAPLNHEFVAEVNRLIEESLQGDQPRIVLDLRQVPLIDSAGLELLESARDRCERSGGSLRVAAPNTLCRDILRVTGVSETVGITSNQT